MAWVSPRTYVVSEIIPASILNTHVRDNLRYLKGMDGVPTIQNGLIVDNTLGTEYLTVPSLTTTQRDALTPVNGMIIYNSTLTVFQRREAGAWISYNNLAAMVIASQAQGDVFYASSATAIARLGAGTSGYVLRTQGAAANPIWDGTVLAYTEITVTAFSGDASGTWDDWDLSSVCPSGSKAVVVVSINGNSPGTLGARKNGSAQDPSMATNTWGVTWVVELDANRIIEAYDASGATYKAVGYFG